MFKYVIKYGAICWPWAFLALIVGILIWDQQNTRHINLQPNFGRLENGEDTLSDSEKISIDPICHMNVRNKDAYSVCLEKKNYFFCNVMCYEKFIKNPSGYLSTENSTQGHTMQGVPKWMYLYSVAIIIILTFGFFEGVSYWKRKYRQDTHDAMKVRWSLTQWPVVRKLIQWAPMVFILRAGTVFLFVLIILAGLFGNQDPTANIAPLLTWTIWWTGLIFLVLYLGKIWCYVCPWDAVATWIERLKFWGVRKSGLSLDLKWPKSLRNIWPAVILFLLLTWIELGMQITVVPRATAVVALSMLFLSIASALVFERKSFCRYACLVGRISGLYSLFSSLELRAQSPDICVDCKTLDCYRGNDNGDSCPTFEFPKKMSVSTYCIMCAECVKSCPQDNIAFRLRPWGSDLTKTGKPRYDEAFLAIILLAMTGFHGLTMTPVWLSWNEILRPYFYGSYVAVFSLLMMMILILPILIFLSLSWLTSRISKEVSWPSVFLQYAYALLPIALFYHLAHNAEHFLMEGPKIFALISDPFGWGWNTFNTAHTLYAPLVTLEGLWWLQILFIIVGHIYSLWITEKITRRLMQNNIWAFWAQIPILVAMVLFSVFSLWLLNQPMEMRISAM